MLKRPTDGAYGEPPDDKEDICELCKLNAILHECIRCKELVCSDCMDGDLCMVCSVYLDEIKDDEEDENERKNNS